MKRKKQIREALFEFNFSKLVNECSKQTISDDGLIELVKLVKQTGCLLLQHASVDRQQQRDRFVEALSEWFSHSGK